MAGKIYETRPLLVGSMVERPLTFSSDVHSSMMVQRKRTSEKEVKVRPRGSLLGWVTEWLNVTAC